MTEPDDLVTVEVPAEQLREGDLLVIDTVEHHVDQVIGDAVPEFVYAFVPEQHPIPRRVLVTVRRPRSATTLGQSATAVDPVEYEATRDLALALAEQVGGKGGKVRAAADRVQARRAERGQ